MADRPVLPGEFEVIARYFAPLSRSLPGAVGLANDTASLAIAPGYEAVVTMDTMVAGVHFLPDDPPDLIARKLLRVNLSDLASSGAEPRAYFLAMSLPATTTEKWIAAFAQGLETDQSIFDIALGGGDTTGTSGPTVLSLTAIGEVPNGNSIRRASATVDQDIYVSGTIGDAALALALIESRGIDDALTEAPDLVERYRLPEPRVALGIALRDIATAAIDVSDGLHADLGHICTESGIGAEIVFSHVPLSPAAARCLAAQPDLSERIVSGGDDYEILFTARPQDASCIAGLAGSLGLPLTRIGKTIRGDAIIVRTPTGEAMHLTVSGWSHF